MTNNDDRIKRMQERVMEHPMTMLRQAMDHVQPLKVGQLYARFPSYDPIFYYRPGFSINRHHLGVTELVMFLGDIQNGYGNFWSLENHKVSWGLLIASTAEELDLLGPRIKALKEYNPEEWTAEF